MTTERQVVGSQSGLHPLSFPGKLSVAEVGAAMDAIVAVFTPLRGVALVAIVAVLRW